MMARKLSICVPAREGPLDTASSGVAPSLPRRQLGRARSLLSGTARQALARRDTNVDLGHIQPARMLGRLVELDPAQQCGCALHTEHFLEALAHVLH
jgi:hypothetical protein